MIFKKIIAGVLSVTVLVTATSMTAFAKQTEKEYDYVALGDSIAAGFGLNRTTRGSLEVLASDPALILTEDLIADPVKDAYAQVFGDYLAQIGQANGYTTTATNLSSTAYRAVDVENVILNEGFKGEVAEWILETFEGEGASAPLADYHDIYIKYLSKAELVSIQLGGNDIVMNIMHPILKMENPVLKSVAVSLMLTLFGCDTETAIGGGIKVLMSGKDKISYKSVTEAAEYISSIKQNADSYVQLAADNVKDVVNAVKTVNETADIALIGMFDPYGNSLVYDGQVKNMSNIIRNIFVKSAEIVCGKAIKTDEVDVLSDEEVEEKTNTLEKNVKALSDYSARVKKFTNSCKENFAELVSLVANEIAYPIQYMTAGKSVKPQMLALNERLKNIAQETGSVYVDVYNISNECDTDPHPNVQGHREIAEIMRDTLSDTVIKGMNGTVSPSQTSEESDEEKTGLTADKTEFTWDRNSNAGITVNTNSDSRAFTLRKDGRIYSSSLVSRSLSIDNGVISIGTDFLKKLDNGENILTFILKEGELDITVNVTDEQTEIPVSENRITVKESNFEWDKSDLIGIAVNTDSKSKNVVIEKDGKFIASDDDRGVYITFGRVGITAKILKKLDVGENRLNLMFDDGTADITVNVTDKKNSSNDTKIITADKTEFTWDRNSSDSIEIHTNSKSDSISVRQNGKIFSASDKKNISINDGVVTMKPEFLAKLNDGENELKLIFNDGNITVKIDVTDKTGTSKGSSTPNTNTSASNKDGMGVLPDTGGTGLAAGAFIILMSAGLAGILMARKKKKLK